MSQIAGAVKGQSHKLLKLDVTELCSLHRDPTPRPQKSQSQTPTAMSHHLKMDFATGGPADTAPSKNAGETQVETMGGGRAGGLAAICLSVATLTVAVASRGVLDGGSISPAEVRLSIVAVSVAAALSLCSSRWGGKISYDVSEVALRLLTAWQFLVSVTLSLQNDKVSSAGSDSDTVCGTESSATSGEALLAVSILCSIAWGLILLYTIYGVAVGSLHSGTFVQLSIRADLEGVGVSLPGVVVALTVAFRKCHTLNIPWIGNGSVCALSPAIAVVSPVLSVFYELCSRAQNGRMGRSQYGSYEGAYLVALSDHSMQAFFYVQAPLYILGYVWTALPAPLAMFPVPLVACAIFMFCFGVASISRHRNLHHLSLTGNSDKDSTDTEEVPLKHGARYIHLANKGDA